MSGFWYEAELGLDKERSKQELVVVLLFSVEGFENTEELKMGDDELFLELSKALFQNPKSMPSFSSSVVLVLLHPPPPAPDVPLLLFGRLICKDKSGCAGNSSIFLLYQPTKQAFSFLILIELSLFYSLLS